MRFSEYQVVATTLSNLYENNYYENLCKKYDYEDIMVRDEHQSCCYSQDAYKSYCYFHIDEYKDKNGNKLSDEAKKKIRYKVYKHELYERIKASMLFMYFMPVVYFTFRICQIFELHIALCLFLSGLITFLSVIPFGCTMDKHYTES